MITPCRYRVSVVRLVVPTVYYIPDLYDPPGCRPMYRVSNRLGYSCAHMLPPVSVAHHNRESVDALIPHFDFFSSCHLFASGSTFKFVPVITAGSSGVM